jgi:hypothetical protein
MVEKLELSNKDYKSFDSGSGLQIPNRKIEKLELCNKDYKSFDSGSGLQIPNRKKKYTIELYNSLGQFVLKENLNNLPTNSINTEFLPSGIYTLKIIFENTSSYKKLIK